MENFPLGAECLQEKLVEGEMAGWSCATQHLYQMVAPLATSFSHPGIVCLEALTYNVGTEKYASR